MPMLRLEDLAELVETGKLVAVEHCPYCSKITYESQQAAKVGAAELAAQGKGHTWSYECPRGRGWHLTSQKRNKSAKVAKVRKQARSSRKKPDRGGMPADN